MKSSKLENTFNYNPPLDDSKTLSPFTYYQPFQSSFDPNFSVPPPKSTLQSDSRSGNRWGSQGIERSGWRFSGFPCASSSSFGEPEGGSLCNSTWRSPAALRSTCLAYEKAQSLKYLTQGGSGSSQFSPKVSLERPPLRIWESFDQPNAQVTNYEETLNHSSYHPLMFGSLGQNTKQNSYRSGHNRPMMCNFCKNNKEVPDIYLNHYLYDPDTKVLSCPVLRKHVCEICGGTGDQAHTLQYCPVNRERGLQSKVPVLLKTRTITNSTGKIRRN